MPDLPNSYASNPHQEQICRAGKESSHPQNNDIFARKKIISQIVLKFPEDGLEKENVDTEADGTKLERITKEFEEQRAKGEHAVTKQFLVDLGLKHGFTIGKYLI